MRLVAPKDGESRPDLVLQVADDPNSGVAGADLVLMDSREAMLWSKALAGTGNRADLRQLMAFTAATILACATEGMDASAGLGHQTLKAYLDACATMADAKYEPLKALHMLESVVRNSPRFTPAWAKLLTAETDAVSNVTLSDAAALRPVLARHIDIARKLEPDLAEAYIAEFILTPPSDFSAEADCWMPQLRAIRRTAPFEPNGRCSWSWWGGWTTPSRTLFRRSSSIRCRRSRETPTFACSHSPAGPPRRRLR